MFACFHEDHPPGISEVFLNINVKIELFYGLFLKLFQKGWGLFLPILLRSEGLFWQSRYYALIGELNSELGELLFQLSVDCRVLDYPDETVEDKSQKDKECGTEEAESFQGSCDPA